MKMRGDVRKESLVPETAKARGAFYRGRTAIQATTERGQIDFARVILDRGANVKTKPSRNGKTTLQLATAACDLHRGGISPQVRGLRLNISAVHYLEYTALGSMSEETTACAYTTKFRHLTEVGQFSNLSLLPSYYISDRQVNDL
jgi:hypothetical protein